MIPIFQLIKLGLITYELMTSDMVKLLDHLNLDSVNVVGWSDGGIIGLHLVMSYPQKVKKLVTIAANFNPDWLDYTYPVHPVHPGKEKT